MVVELSYQFIQRKFMKQTMV